jgi:hypothetical protein
MQQATESRATLDNNGMVCVHCGSHDHNLDACPDISNEQLAQILMQLDEFELDRNDGEMFFQHQSDASIAGETVGGLRSNRLYLNTCTTNDQITNPAYLTGVYTDKKPLIMHMNAGTSIRRKRGMLGNLLFWGGGSLNSGEEVPRAL